MTLNDLADQLTALGWMCEIDSDGRRLIADRHRQASYLRVMAYESPVITEIPCTTYSDDGMTLATRLTPDDCQAIDLIRAYHAARSHGAEGEAE